MEEYKLGEYKEYKEALAAIILEVFGTITDLGLEGEEKWKVLTDRIFYVSEDLDQKELIESIVDKADEAMTCSELISHEHKILIIGAIHFLKKIALQSLKPTEKPEEPKISEIGHGDEGTT